MSPLPHNIAPGLAEASMLNENFTYLDNKITTGGVDVFKGEGSPNGIVEAPVGAMYVDTANTLLYIKLSGDGNTGWSTTLARGGLKIVTEYGAKGDGVTDDTMAIQRALDDTGSGTLFFPLGVYIITKECLLYYEGMRTLGESMGDVFTY
jgi:polygalacturonase